MISHFFKIEHKENNIQSTPAIPMGEKKQNGFDAIFHIPHSVDIKLIKSNNELIIDSEISRITEYLKDKPDGRYSKKDLKIPYGAIKDKDGIYLVYNHNGKEFKVGQGISGDVKYLKKLGGEWHILKTIKKRKNRDEELSKLEYITLRNLKMAPGKLFWRKNKKEQLKFEFILFLVKGHTFRKFTEENEKNKKSIIFRLTTALEILKKVKALHLLNYLHRDIKQDNMMIYYHPTKNTIEIELIDYGFAAPVPNGNEYKGGNCYGSPGYIAPEIEKNFKESKMITYSEKTEIFAIGNLLNKFLFSEDFTKHNDVLSDFKNKLMSMKNDDANKRPTINEAIDSLSSALTKLNKNEDLKEEYSTELNEACQREKNRLKKANNEIKDKNSSLKICSIFNQNNGYGNTANISSKDHFLNNKAT